MANREQNLKDLNWFVFDEFLGYQTKWDANHPKARGYFVNNSKNCRVNETGALEPRFGTKLLGTSSSATTPIMSMGKFANNDGTDILLRSYGTVLQFYHTTNLAWTDLATGFTTGKIFGFEMDEISSDGQPYLYYCNGVENYARWDGNQTTKTPTEYAAAPKGNVLHRTDNARMMIANVPAAYSTIYVSKTDNPIDFTYSTPRVATDGAVINVGNVVNGLGQLGDKIYWFCKRLIGWITFTQTPEYSGGYDIIQIRPEVDGGPTGDDVGCVSQLAVMKYDNKILFVSPTGMIKDLGSVVQHAVFQAEYIGDPIKPDLDNANMSSAAGIVYKGKAYVAAKKDDDSTFNDRIFVYDILRGRWEAPLNKNANCFLVANNLLYFGSSVNPEVYQLEVEDYYNDLYNDGTNNQFFPINVEAYSWRESFGLPANPKRLYECYLEGEIKRGTTITYDILLNEDGVSGKISADITSTDSGIIFSKSTRNTLAINTLSSQLIGTERITTASGLDIFRVFFRPNIAPSFFNLQFRVYSNGSGYNYKIKKVGFKIDKYNYRDKNLIKALS